MPSHFVSKILALGLATLTGLGVAAGPGPDPVDTVASPPEVESVPAQTRIAPALLANPTLRRAIATVGPDLLADPEVREAIRTGRVGPSLLSNPAVSRAFLRVGPSLMADPQLAAAVRSGELGPHLLNDPAVISMIAALDPTLAMGPPDTEPGDAPAPTQQTPVTPLPDVGVDSPDPVIAISSQILGVANELLRQGAPDVSAADPQVEEEVTRRQARRRARRARPGRGNAQRNTPPHAQNEVAGILRDLRSLSRRAGRITGRRR